MTHAMAAPAVHDSPPAPRHLVALGPDPDTELVERFRARRLRRIAPGTVREQTVVVRAFAHWLSPRLLPSATATDVEGFLASRPITRRTRINKAVALRAFFSMIEEEGLIDTSPAALPEVSVARFPLDDLVDSYIDERLRRRTLGPVSAHSYRSHLHVVVRGLGPLEPQEVTRNHIEEWLAARFSMPLSPLLRTGCGQSKVAMPSDLLF